MKLNIKTKQDIEVNKEQLNNILIDVLKITEDLNKKYDLNLESIFKFERKTNEKSNKN